MNTKNRALLWEEIHVGGSIAFVTLLGGLLAQIALVDQYRKSSGELLLFFPALGFPLLAALLLTLSTANSGHLMGGFSRRILRLPVDLWSTVLIILLSRLLAVLSVSALLAAVSWGFFGAGPSADAVLLLGMAYLLIQVLDWLRAPAASLVVTIIALLLLALLMHLTGFKPIPYLELKEFSKTLPLLIAFPPAVGVAYALSLVAVGYTRRGAKLDLSSRLNLARLFPTKRVKQARPFSTPAAAQTWYERRRAGIFLPVATVIFWMLCIGLYLFVSWNTRSPVSYSATLTVAPFFAFILAAIAWHLRIERTQFWRRSRPASYFLRLPVEPVDLVRARIAISALIFIAVWLIVVLVIRSPFATSVLRDLLRSAYANGEITAREITTLVIGIPLLLGLLGWIAAHVPWKLVALEFLLGFTATCVKETSVYALGGLMIALPFIWFARELVRARAKGLLPLWSLFACLLVWAAIAFAVFPYGFLNLRPHPAVLCLATASFAALVVLPFPSLLLAAPGHLVGERLAHVHAACPGTGFTPRRALGLCALVGFFATVAWVRSTTEPTFEARLRAEGLPTTFADLYASYKPVPDESNLALRYMKAGDDLVKLREAWTSTGKQKPVAAPGDLRGQWDDGLMIVGNSDVKDTDLIPQAVWEATSDYWQQVGKPVTDELHTIAQSGLNQSRYPLDSSAEFYERSAHLSSLTDLAYQLHIEALVAAVEGRPEAVAGSLSDALALADSLKSEPTISAQMTRMNILLMVETSLESAMNRRVFSNEELLRFQSIFHTALSSGVSAGMTESIMTEALVATLRNIKTHTYLGLLFDGHFNNPDAPDTRIKEAGLAPALDLLGWMPMNYLVATRTQFMLIEMVRKQRERGYTSKDDPLQVLFTSNLFPIVTMSYASSIPVDGTVYEYLVQAHFAAAETGVAIERYRLANGRLPENLAQLVPQFLDRVPTDPFNEAAPLSYLPAEDGGFAVYSLGVDHKDDHGEKGWKDITFALASPELRGRPQIAADTEPSSTEKAS